MRKRSTYWAHIVLSLFLVFQMVGTGLMVLPAPADANHRPTDPDGSYEDNPSPTGLDFQYATPAGANTFPFGQNITFPTSHQPALGLHPETGDYVVITGVTSRYVRFSGQVEFRDSDPANNPDTETLLVKVWNSNWGPQPDDPSDLLSLPNAKRVGSAGTTFQDYALLDDCLTAASQDVVLSVPGSDQNQCANTNFINTYEFEIPQFVSGTVLFVYAGGPVVNFTRTAQITVPDSTTSLTPLQLNFQPGVSTPTLQLSGNVCAGSDDPLHINMTNGNPNARIDMHFTPAPIAINEATLRTTCTGTGQLRPDANGNLDTDITLCQIQNGTVSAEDLPAGTYQVYVHQPLGQNSNTQSITLNSCAPTINVTKVARLTSDNSVVGTRVLQPTDAYYYQINYTNTGNAAATNARLTDTYDPTFIESVTAAGAEAVTNGSITWNLGTVDPGQSGTRRFDVNLHDKMNDRVTGTYDIPNQVTITADGGLTDSDTETVQVGYAADPYLDKTLRVFDGTTGAEKNRNQLAAGDIVTYTIEYGNNGNANATNARIVDTITNYDKFSVYWISENNVPSGVEDNVLTIDWDPVGDNGDCRPTGKGCGEPAPSVSQCTAQLNTYGCRDESGIRQVMIKINSTLPSGSTVIDEDATLHYDGGSDTDSEVVTVTAASACVVTKAVDKAEANPGDTLTYTVTYRNNSTNAACTSVSIEDAMNGQNQDKLTILPQTVSNGGTVSQENNVDVITWTIGTVVPQAQGSVTYQARIDEDIPTDGETPEIFIINDATLFSAELPQGVLSNEVITRIGFGPVLTIVKAVDKSQAKPGENIVYTLTVRNVGSLEATNVVVNDPFNNANQNYITFVSSEPNKDTTGNNQFSLGTLAVNETKTVKITAKISDDVPVKVGGTLIFDMATVTSEETPTQESNEVTTFVNPVVTLVVAKAVNVTTVRPNDTFVYTVTYKNEGDAKATNVVVKDPFNNANQNLITFVSSVPNPDPGKTDQWTLGTLNPGASGKIDITARLKNEIPTGQTIIDDIAKVSTQETGERTTNKVSIVALFSPPLANPPATPSKLVPTTGTGMVIVIGVAVLLGLVGAGIYVSRKRGKGGHTGHQSPGTNKMWS